METSENFINDYELDIAIREDKDMNACFEVEENPDYSNGQTVKLVGYPDYAKGNSIDIRLCKIASVSSCFEQLIYIIDGDIFHGASGGPVLNENNKVIGIIRAGVDCFNLEDAKNNMKRGFIPIKEIQK